MLIHGSGIILLRNLLIHKLLLIELGQTIALGHTLMTIYVVLLLRLLNSLFKSSEEFLLPLILRCSARFIKIISFQLSQFFAGFLTCLLKIIVVYFIGPQSISQILINFLLPLLYRLLSHSLSVRPLGHSNLILKSLNSKIMLIPNRWSISIWCHISLLWLRSHHGLHSNHG